MDPIEIDLAATYDVTLSRPVMRGSFKMLPRDRHTLRGDFFLATVEREGWDVVAAAAEVRK